MSKIKKYVKYGPGLWFEDERGVIASATYRHPDYDTDAAYVLSFHNGEMPAFNSITFDTADELEAEMRKFESDLRKWCYRA